MVGHQAAVGLSAAVAAEAGVAVVADFPAVVEALVAAEVVEVGSTRNYTQGLRSEVPSCLPHAP